MLYAQEDIYSGIFDSGIFRKNAVKSQNRLVDCYELELFHNDTGVSYVNGVKHPVRRGMILCAKPGQIRHSDFPVRCSFIRVFPNGAARTGVNTILDTLPDCLYSGDERKIEHLLGLFHKLQNCFISSAPPQERQVKINGLFFEILYHCVRLRNGEAEEALQSPANSLVRDAYEYINENYTQACSLKHIADALNISPNHLHSVFTRHMGITPFEYMTQKRIERAKKLIMAGEKTMLEIAMDIGFCSQSHFNKVFKEKTGTTPIEYRGSLWQQY